MLVALFACQGASAVDLALAAETLRAAGDAYRVQFVAEAREPDATSVPELWLHPARSVAEPPAALDTLVVLGGTEPDRPSLPALQWLGRAATVARRCAATGAGAFPLAAVGALDGRRATTAPRLAALLAERAPRALVDGRLDLVRDGPLLTCAGGASTLRLMLELIREDRGAAAAQSVAGALGHRAPVEDSATASPGGKAAAIGRVAAHVRAHPGAPHRIASLAARAAMSERTFTRAFQEVTGESAGAFVRQVRVAHARRLLAGSDLPIKRVLSLSGFATPGAGRRAFERMEGMSPMQYRRLHMGLFDED